MRSAVSLLMLMVLCAARLKTCCDMANTYLNDLKENVEPEKSDEAFDSAKLHDTMGKIE